MATNVLVNFFNADNEQDLLQSLTQEAIRFGGHDMWYVPRTVENRDAIFTEAEFASYNSAFSFEFYIKTTSQMGGEGAMLSKFNIEIRDELVVTVSKRTFQEEVLTTSPDILRPREGDLIYIPMIGSLFTIKYVDKRAFFYQLGDLQAYDLSLELYEASSAVFDTGVPEIDDFYQPITDDILQLALTTELGEMIVDETNSWPLVWQSIDDEIDISQNDELEDLADEIIVWTETDPFSEGGTY